MSKNQSSMGVAIRIRPLSSKERDRGDMLCWKPNENANSLQIPDDARQGIKTLKSGQPLKLPKFKPESVFGDDCTTTDVYNAVGKHVVNGSLRGINGTILAYGQTSSGKTHTMLGDQDCPGVVLLAVRDIFQHISENEERNFLLRVSMIEIYNEVVADLLIKGNDHLGVFNGKDGRDVIIKGVHEEFVTSAAQVWSLLETGFQNRSVSGTDMNAGSSRSHTVFRMVIESRAIGADEKSKVRVSALNMVDLAGSERMEHAGTSGTGKKMRRNEGININKSLLTLGTVIKQLMKQAARGEKQHIQYRNSMLTRVLAKSIGGSAQTAVICTLAPSHVYYADSKITLGFAANACQVKVKARVNDVKAQNAMLGAHAEEMAKLKDELKRWPQGKPENFQEVEVTKKEMEEMVAKREEEVVVRTEEVRREYQEKLAHLQSLILQASSSGGGSGGGSGSGGGARGGVTSGGGGLTSSFTFGGRKQRETWGPGEVHKLVVENYRRGSLGLSSRGVTLECIGECNGEEQNDGHGRMNGRSSSSSVVSVRDDMTMEEAMDEIRILKERVSAEEEDRFDAENELWELTQDYALLTEGTGIEKKMEEELNHMEHIYEEGMVRVMKEKYRKKMMERENKLLAEVENLKITLSRERDEKDDVIQQETLRLTEENQRLQEQVATHQVVNAELTDETSTLKEQMIQQQEECERKVEETTQKVFEHEKLLRAARAMQESATPVKKKSSTFLEENNVDENEMMSNSDSSSTTKRTEMSEESESTKKNQNSSTTRQVPPTSMRKAKKIAHRNATPLRAAFGC